MKKEQVGYIKKKKTEHDAKKSYASRHIIL